MGQVMNIGPMGGGNVIFKRKFRWNFTLNFTCAGQNFNFTATNVATGARPKISIGITEVHYMGSKLKIPEQEVDYEPLQFTFYDLIGLDLTVFYIWIHSFFRLSNPENVSTPNSSVYGTVLLEMLDGCGEVIETWILEQCWPSEIDFGELDMSSSEPAMINLTMVYNLATLNPDNCSGLLIPTCCGISTDSINISQTAVQLPTIPDVFPLPSNTGTYTGNYSNLTVSTGSTSITFEACSTVNAFSVKMTVYINLDNGNRIVATKKTYNDPMINPNCTENLIIPLATSITSYDVNVDVDGSIDSYSS